MHNVAIWYNFKIRESMESFDFAASWLLQGSLYGDPDCQAELVRYESYTSDPDWIKDSLFQRTQYQAAVDFEDGRITFPFNETESKVYKDEVTSEDSVNSSGEPISKNSFESKCGILGQFWYEFRDDEDLKPFIGHNDVGLPLAWFISTGIVTPLPMAEEYVNETFAMFLDAMEVTEEDVIDVDNLDDLLSIVEEKKNEAKADTSK
jgi:hypothetical protein